MAAVRVSYMLLKLNDKVSTYRGAMVDINLCELVSYMFYSVVYIQTKKERGGYSSVDSETNTVSGLYCCIKQYIDLFYFI